MTTLPQMTPGVRNRDVKKRGVTHRPKRMQCSECGAPLLVALDQWDNSVILADAMPVTTVGELQAKLSGNDTYTVVHVLSLLTDLRQRFISEPFPPAPADNIATVVAHRCGESWPINWQIAEVIHKTAKAIDPNGQIPF